MRRSSFLTTLPLLVVPALAPLPSAAQSLPSKKEAAEILDKAGSRMVLARPGAPPFHLIARLRYQIDKMSVDGTYEILWASASQYREEFRLGQLSATDVALGDKLYILRNTPTLTYPQWRVRMLTGLPKRGDAPSNAPVAKVYASKDDPQHLVCARLDLPHEGVTKCFAKDTGELMSIQTKADEISFSSVSDDFMEFGDVRYPRHVLSTMADNILEVHLDKLAAVARFADEVFKPPEGSTAHDWCPQPETRNQQGEGFVSWLAKTGVIGPPSSGFDGFHGYYYYTEVAPDGRIERVAAISPDGSSKDLPTKTASDVRFPVLSCAGKSIEYEIISGVGTRGP